MLTWIVFFAPRPYDWIMALRKAVNLLSGGVDSVTVMALAKQEGYELHALSFRYGQRHQREIEAAKRVAESLRSKDHLIVGFDLRDIGGSALADHIEISKRRSDRQLFDGIPITYVSARNAIFLSFALFLADKVGTGDILSGANQLDYSLILH